MIGLLFALPFVPLVIVLAAWRASTSISGARRLQGEVGYWDEGLTAARWIGTFATGAIAFVYGLTMLPASRPQLVPPMLFIGGGILAFFASLSAILLYVIWARGSERWLSPFALMLCTALAVFLAFGAGAAP